jgi:hypothetical protein
VNAFADLVGTVARPTEYRVTRAIVVRVYVPSSQKAEMHFAVDRTYLSSWLEAEAVFQTCLKDAEQNTCEWFISAELSYGAEHSGFLPFRVVKSPAYRRF